MRYPSRPLFSACCEVAARALALLSWLLAGMRMENLKDRAIRGGIAKICGQGVTFTLRLAYLVVMARLLSPEDFGLVAMVTIVTGFYDLFTSAGLSSATIQKGVITAEQVSTLFWINILVGAILAMLCLATAPVLVAFYHEPRLLRVALAMGAGFLANAAGVQHIALLQRDMRYVALTAMEVTAQFVSTTIGIAMAVGGFGYWALVAAALAGPATMTSLAWILTAWIPGMPRRTAEISAMLRFGGTVTLHSAALHITENVDKLLLGRFWGAAALGTYGRAYQLINIPMANISSAIGWVAFSALSRLQNEPDRYKTFFLRGYSLSISLTLPITLFCSFFADDMVHVVLGAKWEAAALIFRLLTPAALVLTIVNPPTFWLLHSLGLPARALRIALALACLVSVACLLGLPYGPTGVAFAYSAVMTLWFVPHLLWCLHNTVISLPDLFRTIRAPVLASVAAAGLSFVAASQVATSPEWRLVTGAFAMGCSFPLILLFGMGQKSVYLRLVRELTGSAPAS
jgi:PST family polysaccharide transporter